MNLKITNNCKQYISPSTESAQHNIMGISKIDVDFWPPSDGDTFDENQLSDNDLV